MVPAPASVVNSGIFVSGICLLGLLFLLLSLLKYPFPVKNLLSIPEGYVSATAATF